MVTYASPLGDAGRMPTCFDAVRAVYPFNSTGCSLPRDRSGTERRNVVIPTLAACAMLHSFLVSGVQALHLIHAYRRRTCIVLVPAAHLAAAAGVGAAIVFFSAGLILAPSPGMSLSSLLTVSNPTGSQTRRISNLRHLLLYGGQHTKSASASRDIAFCRAQTFAHALTTARRNHGFLGSSFMPAWTWHLATLCVTPPCNPNLYYDDSWRSLRLWQRACCVLLAVSDGSRDAVRPRL